MKVAVSAVVFFVFLVPARAQFDAANPQSASSWQAAFSNNASFWFSRPQNSGTRTNADNALPLVSLRFVGQAIALFFD
jgi:hypothetical protein